MGRTEIEEKLNIFLEDRKYQFTEECEVVYFLVEARKILEHQRNKSEYKFLNFYADWALHIKKDRNFVREVKELVKKASSSITSRGEPFSSLDNFYLDLNSFRKDVGKFLKNHNLPNELVNEDWLWEEFTDLYGKVVSDQPIELPIQTKIMIINVTKNGSTVTFNTEVKSNTWPAKN